MEESLPQRCLDCLVRDKALCGSLGDKQLLDLSLLGRRKVVPKGSVVTWEGDDNPICANIVTGALKLQASTADGREQTVGLLFSGDFIGEPFEEESAVTAEALADTDLCIFPRSGFERVLDDQPQLERALLERTLKSLREARERQLVLGRKSARARLAWFLLSLPRGCDGTIDLPIARQEIADYLGLTIETVSRQFTDLRSSGVIDAERGGRRLRVVDVTALQDAAE
ncbi:Crp/Fnr family transcriptional regulator [Sphingomicrobium nitratireducens]|uniref:Crp/Fnr family transcriptional regulator n=1 Tax=Sphingomicrobium nitratireducens TaxID=2964666 RepID=UPI002240676F|nr:Crp/Fnr family transcriptional regulator [Sphingomicrobium nitratireducens]